MYSGAAFKDRRTLLDSPCHIKLSAASVKLTKDQVVELLGKRRGGRAVAAVFFVVVDQLVPARPCEEVVGGGKRTSLFSARSFKALRFRGRSR